MTMKMQLNKFLKSFSINLGNLLLMALSKEMLMAPDSEVLLKSRQLSMTLMVQLKENIVSALHREILALSNGISFARNLGLKVTVFWQLLLSYQMIHICLNLATFYKTLKSFIEVFVQFLSPMCAMLVLIGCTSSE